MRIFSRLVLNGLLFRVLLLLAVVVFISGCSKLTATIGGKKKSRATESVKISLSDIQVTEGDGAVVVFVLSKPAPSNLTVNWSLTGAGAVADFVATSGTVVVAQGQQSGSSTISTVENAIFDLSRIYQLELAITSTNETAQVNFEIVDDEATPAIQFSAATQNVNEGAVAPTYQVNISPVSKFSVIANYTVAGTATAAVDHNLSSGTISIPAMTASVTPSLSIIDDGAVEATETIALTLTSINSGTAVIGATSVQTVSIIDNENANLTIDDVAITEGGVATLTVSLSSVPGAPVTFDWATANGTALSGTSYTAASGTTVTITPPATTAQFTVNSISNLTSCETDKVFAVNISNVVGAVVADGAAQVTIEDNDLPTVYFSAASSSVTEGSNAAVTARLNAICATHDVSIQVTTTDGTAVSAGGGADFTALSAQTVTIAAGDLTEDVSVTTTNDSRDENDETLTLAMANPTDATLGATTSHTLTINDNDAAPTISIADVTVTEGTGAGATNATFTVTASAVSDLSITAAYATSNGTATTGASDYTSTTGTATISAGSTSTTFSVPIGRDALDEIDETFNVTLSAGGNYSPVGSTLSAIGTITDDDAAPTISLSNLSVNEASGSATVVATLSTASGRAISFDWATAAVSATAGSDYTTTSAASESIAAGSTTKNLVVPILNDATLCESIERFTVSLSNLVDVGAGTLSSTVSITDDDRPLLTSSVAPVTEGTAQPVNLTLSFACPQDVSIDYFTVGNTATAGDDFVHASGSVTIPTGFTVGSVNISTTDDLIRESDSEKYFVSFYNSEPIQISGASFAEAAINDDEAGTVTVKVASSANHSCALNSAGEIKCWGMDWFRGYDGAHRGDQPGEMGDLLPAMQLGTRGGLGLINHTAKAVSHDLNATCVILDDDTVKCWGAGNLGTLGSGTVANALVGDEPHEVADAVTYVKLGTRDADGINRHTVKKIVSGAGDRCAILDDDRVKCWGDNTTGGLGHSGTRQGDADSEVNDSMPYLNLGTHDGLGVTAHKVKALAGASSPSFCAILDDNRLKCWGSNSSGQLGIESASSRGLAVGSMGDNLPYVDLGPGRYAKSIDGGSSHFCAILDNDQVKCWGVGNMLGLGLSSAVRVGDAANEMGVNLPYVDLGTHDGLGVTPHTAKSISAGPWHTCAILDDDRLKCWGENAGGQLGLGIATNLHKGDGPNEMGDNLPYVSLGTGKKASQIKVKNENTYVIRDDGSLVVFGRNNYGQAGVGHANIIGDSPAEMGDALVSVDLGTGLTAVALDDGNGYSSACAVLNNGQVKCWGSNEVFHGIGVGREKVLIGAFANQMGLNLPKVNLPLGTVAVDIEVQSGGFFGGQYDTHVLLSDGRMLNWGNSGSGTGRGNSVNSMGANMAADVMFAPGGLKYRSIYPLYRGGCAIDENFDLRCWGASVPDQIPGFTFYSASVAPIVNLGTGRKALSFASMDYGGNIGAGCALLDNQTIKCFGDGNAGRLGYGASSTVGKTANSMGDFLPAVDLGTVAKPVSITMGTSHTCALFDNGRVKCWGTSTSIGLAGVGGTKGDAAGEMGDLLPFLDLGVGRTAKSVVAGGDSTCAIRDDNSLVCWGSGSAGQLGNGSTVTIGDGANEMGNFLAPVDLNGGIPTKLSRGSGTSCALLSDNSVKCWGLNNYGQLGLGDVNHRGDVGGEMGASLPALDLQW